MRATQFTIRNILGARDVDIKLGEITHVNGRNGTGKSSVIETLKALLGGGTDATLLPAGAKNGEAVLVLDDDTQIKLRLTQKGQYKSAKGPSAPQGGVQTWLDEICSARSLNPVAFLEGSDKDRIEMLVRASGISLSDDDMAPFAKWAETTVGGDPIKLLDGVAKAIYDERTGVNRSARDKRAAASGISTAMPEGDPEEIRAAAARATEKHGNLLVEKQKASSGADSDLERLTRAADAEYRHQVDRIDRHLQGQIDALKQRAQAARDKAMEIKNTAVSAANKEYRSGVEVINASYDEQIAKAAEESTRLSEQARAHDRAAESRRLAEKMASEAAQLESESADLSSKLDQLESLKIKLMSKLPVPGLSIRDGKLFHGDVPWVRVNEAEQKRIAVEISAQFAGPLGMVVIDGAECFDDANRASLEAALREKGLQAVIATRTEDAALKVESA